MHDAQLYLSLRVNRFNGFGEALQAIATGDKDIIDAAIFKLVHHR